MMQALASVAVRGRFFILVAFAAAVGAAAFLSKAPVFIRGDDGILLPDDPDVLRDAKFSKLFGKAETAVLLTTSPNLFTNENITSIRALNNKLERVEGVKSVISLTSASTAVLHGDQVEFKKIVPEGPLDDKALADAKAVFLGVHGLVGRILSADGNTTMLAVSLSTSLNFAQKQAVVDKIKAAVAAVPSQLHWDMGGGVFANVEFESLRAHEFLPLVALFILISTVLSWILLRDYRLVIVHSAAVAFVVGSVFLIAAATQTVLDMTAVLLLPISGFIASGATLLALVRVQQELAAKPNMAASTLAQVWFGSAAPPVLLTLAACILPLASLLLTPLLPILAIGRFTLLATALSVFTTLLLSPSLLCILGCKKPAPRGSVTVASQLASFGHRHARVLSALAAVLIAGGAAGACLVTIDSNPYVFLPRTDYVRIGNDAIDGRMTGPMPVEITLHADDSAADFTHPEALAKVDALQDVLLRQFPADFSSGLSVTEYLKEMHKSFADNGKATYALPATQAEVTDYSELIEMSNGSALAQLISADKRSVRLSLSEHMGRPNAAKRVEALLAERGREILGQGISYQVTGIGQTYDKINDLLLRCNVMGWIAVVLTVGLFSFLAARSALLTVLGCLTAAIPCLLVFGALGLSQIPLSVTTSVFPAVIGLVALFSLTPVLAQLRRLRDTGLADTAVTAAVAKAAPPLVAITVTIAIGGLCLTPSVFLDIATGGVITACASAVALLAPLLFLPAFITTTHRPKRTPDSKRSSQIYDLAS